MKARRPTTIAARVRFLAMATTLVATAGGLFAFQSTQIQTVTCGVMVGGTRPAPQSALDGPIQIQHAPLSAVSAVTRMAIIQGEAGTILDNFHPTFAQRIT